MAGDSETFTCSDAIRNWKATDERLKTVQTEIGRIRGRLALGEINGDQAIAAALEFAREGLTGFGHQTELV